MKQNGVTDKDVQRMLSLIFGTVHAQAVTAAAELGIAELLDGQALPVEELAEATATKPAALDRLLRLLVQLGVLAEPTPATYALTAMGGLLRQHDPHSLYNYARLTNCDTVTRVAAHLPDGVKTGTSQFRALFDGDFYETLPERPDEAAKFAGAMSDIAHQDLAVVDTVCDFSDCRLLIDVGGGQGHLLAALLDKYPQMRAVLFDLPTVVNDVPPLLRPHVESGRCEIQGGNFLDSVPAGGDVYMLKRVLSHCDDAAAATLLQNLRKGITANGRLLVADPDPDSVYGASFDVLMLVLLGGGLRTDAQLHKLFRQSKFAYESRIEGSPALRLVVARPD